MFKSIVVATDGSETASEAVRQAAQLAGALGARVHLVCVYEPVPSAQDAEGGIDLRSESGWVLHPREAVDATLAAAAKVFAAAGAINASGDICALFGGLAATDVGWFLNAMAWPASLLIWRRMSRQRCACSRRPLTRSCAKTTWSPAGAERSS